MFLLLSVRFRVPDLAPTAEVLPSNATAPNVVLKKSKTVMSNDTVLKVNANEQPGGGLVRVPGPSGGVLVGRGLGPKLMADKDGAGASDPGVSVQEITPEAAAQLEQGAAEQGPRTLEGSCGV